MEEEFPESQPLRSLASLNWPYVPEESKYPDPLKRDDPKSLRLHDYEAIGSALLAIFAEIYLAYNVVAVNTPTSYIACNSTSPCSPSKSF